MTTDSQPIIIPYTFHQIYRYRNACELCEGFVAEAPDHSVGLQGAIYCERFPGAENLGRKVKRFGEIYFQPHFPFAKGCKRFKDAPFECQATDYTLPEKRSWGNSYPFRCRTEMVLVFDWTPYDPANAEMTGPMSETVKFVRDLNECEVRRWKCPKCGAIHDELRRDPTPETEEVD